MRRWRWSDWTVDQRLFYAEAGLFLGGAFKKGTVGSFGLRMDQISGI